MASYYVKENVNTICLQPYEELTGGVLWIRCYRW